MLKLWQRIWMDLAPPNRATPSNNNSFWHLSRSIVHDPSWPISWGFPLCAPVGFCRFAHTGPADPWGAVLIFSHDWRECYMLSFPLPIPVPVLSSRGWWVYCSSSSPSLAISFQIFSFFRLASASDDMDLVPLCGNPRFSALWQQQLGNLWKTNLFMDKAC